MSHKCVLCSRQKGPCLLTRYRRKGPGISAKSLVTLSFPLFGAIGFWNAVVCQSFPYRCLPWRKLCVFAKWFFHWVQRAEKFHVNQMSCKGAKPPFESAASRAVSWWKILCSPSTWETSYIDINTVLCRDAFLPGCIELYYWRFVIPDDFPSLLLTSLWGSFSLLISQVSKSRFSFSSGVLFINFSLPIQVDKNDSEYSPSVFPYRMLRYTRIIGPCSIICSPSIHVWQSSWLCTAARFLCLFEHRVHFLLCTFCIQIVFLPCIGASGVM